MQRIMYYLDVRSVGLFVLKNQSSAINVKKIFGQFGKCLYFCRRIMKMFVKYGLNLRDLGGIATADGSGIPHGLFLRSGKLSLYG